MMLGKGSNPFRTVGRLLRSSAPRLGRAAAAYGPGGETRSILGRTAVRRAAEALGVKLARGASDETAAAKVEAALAAADDAALVRLKEADLAFADRCRELRTMDAQARLEDRRPGRGGLAQLRGGMRVVAIWTGASIVTAWVASIVAVVYVSLFLGRGLQDAALVISLIANLGAAAGVIVNLFFGGNPSEGKDAGDGERKGKP